MDGFGRAPQSLIAPTKNSNLEQSSCGRTQVGLRMSKAVDELGIQEPHFSGSLERWMDRLVMQVVI